MTSPNQRTIVSNKTEVVKGTGKKRPFLNAYRDIIENAAKVLNGNAFKLYIYLLCQNKGWNFGFSPKDVAESFGCSADTVRTSFATLVNNGFLTLESGKKAKYVFTDIPATQPITQEKTIESTNTENNICEPTNAPKISKEFIF